MIYTRFIDNSENLEHNYLFIIIMKLQYVRICLGNYKQLKRNNIRLPHKCQFIEFWNSFKASLQFSKSVPRVDFCCTIIQQYYTTDKNDLPHQPFSPHIKQNCCNIQYKTLYLSINPRFKSGTRNSPYEPHTYFTYNLLT